MDGFGGFRVRQTTIIPCGNAQQNNIRALTFWAVCFKLINIDAAEIFEKLDTFGIEGDLK